MIAASLLALLASAAPAAGPTTTPAVASAPEVVVERIVEVPGRTTRLTLFDNRIAVVSRREVRSHVLRRRLLTPSEHQGYRLTLTREAPLVAAGEVVAPGPAEPSRAVLRLRTGLSQPRTISYSLLAVQPLPLGRLLRALDALEAEVLATPPAQVELATWRPRVGDRLELAGGARGTIIRITDAGALEVEHDRTHIREVIPPGAWDAAIHRLLDDRQPP